jgi:hypothetical protein
MAFTFIKCFKPTFIREQQPSFHAIRNFEGKICVMKIPEDKKPVTHCVAGFDYGDYQMMCIHNKQTSTMKQNGNFNVTHNAFQIT